MRYFVYFTMEEGCQPNGEAPSPEAMAEIANFHAEQTSAGTIVTMGRLSATTTRIVKGEEDVAVTDGPFIEGKELIPGFTIIEVETREKAVEWVSRYRQLLRLPELRMAEIFG